MEDLKSEHKLIEEDFPDNLGFNNNLKQSTSINEKTNNPEVKKKKKKPPKKNIPVDDDGVENQVFKFQYVHDSNGIIKYISEDITHMTGFRKNSLMEQSYHKFIPEEHREDASKNTNLTIEKAMNNEKEKEKELEDKHKNDTKESKDIKVNSDLNEETQIALKDDVSHIYECYVIKRNNNSKDNKILVRVYEKPVFETITINDKVTNIVKGVQGVIVLSEKVPEFEKEMCSILLNKSIIWLSLVDCKHNKRKMLGSDHEHEHQIEEEIKKYEKIADTIVELFEDKIQYLNPKGDMWKEQGRKIFYDQIMFFLKKHLPINFILPAFPFKSANKYKTLGRIPDKGEELALELIHSFCEEINKIYEFGICFNIVSDGRVFADILKIPDKDVDDYDGILRYKYPQYTKYIKFFDLAYFLDTADKHDEAREKLLKLFGKSTAKIQEKIETDDEYKKMYLGFSKFILEDLFFIMDDDDKNKIGTENTLNISRMKIKNEVKLYAKQVMRRNDAYSKMIENLFPLYVRLSIHAHNNSGPKFAIRLLPMDKVAEKLVGDKNMHIPTPWHNVVIQNEEGKYMMMKKYRVKHLKNCELIYDKEGIPSYYKINKIGDEKLDEKTKENFE